MKKNIFCIILLSVIQIYAEAQSSPGSWRSHLPFTNASRIILAGNKVYCATDGGLFYYDQSDQSIEKISKEDGLSDTEISALGYSEESGITIIAYGNANIDLIQNNKVFNIPDILNSQIMGDKRIYSVKVEGKNAYLCTGFGIILLNLERKEITETYKIGEGGAHIKINEICSDGQYLYAATDQGIYKADLSAPNLLDFNYWIRITNIPNFSKKFNAIASINGRIYTSYQSGVVNGDIIYFLEGNIWKVLTGFTNDNCNFLSEWNGNLVVSGLTHVLIFSQTGEKDMILINSPKCAYIDQNSVIWAADSNKGLVRRSLNENIAEELNPNGPQTIFVSDIKISQNILYSVPGGLTSASNNQFRYSEVNVFKNKTWSGYKKNPDYRDFYRIAIDPVNPEHYFVASWGYGLFEYINDSIIQIYRDNNSSLQTVIPGDFFRLGGLAFDNEGNLWVSNSSVARPLSVFIKKTKEWVSFSLNNLVTSSFTGDIIVTRDGYKWMLCTPGKGIIVIDDNKTPSNPDDDRYKKIDIKDEYNSIITNEIYSLAEDHNGNIWLGSNKGVLVYYNPSAVFEGENFYAQNIKVPRNDGTDAADYLLVTESVSAIAIDGANRKWLGTKNAGVSLVSDDGIRQLHNFTAENSPLLSNSITSIAINDKNGEVYFGTDKGIISYVADAIGPAENFNSVFVFPNPVREDFTGDVAITGLLENTTVKITDLNGNLVFETISLGGQALWDGRNFRGEKVMTGVYLVFCSNEDGSLSHVTKLLFIH